jgi:hypothetical protein
MKLNENIVPFFRIRKTSNKTGIVKCHGVYNRVEEKLHDREMEIDLKTDSPFYKEYYGKDTLYIGKIKGYDVTIKFYECNLSGHFLLANENYPLYYFGVYYKNKFVGGSLITYFFMFSMSDETHKHLTRPPSPIKSKKTKKSKQLETAIQKPNQFDGKRYAARYVNSTLYGNFAFEMSMSDKLKKDYKYYVKEYLTKKRGDSDDISDSDIDEYSIFFETINENELKQYASADYIKNKFMEVINNPKFLDVIEISLIRREKERREDAGIDSDEEYEPPKEEDVISLINEEELMKRFQKDLEL